MTIYINGDVSARDFSIEWKCRVWHGYEVVDELSLDFDVYAQGEAVFLYLKRAL